MNYEQKIKEARTIEAMKSGYMGLGGKFCQIAKKLGFPIVKQGGIYSDATEFESYYDLESQEEEILTMDEDEKTFEIGWQFDGLSRGMNLSITIYFHLNEIVVINEGRTVYKESSGELESYVPQELWQSNIEKLFNLTKKIDRLNRINENKNKEKVNEERKNTILENLRNRWGI
jgi:hypothetical protein